MRVGAIGHRGMQQVRQSGEEIIELGRQRSQSRLPARELVAELPDLALHCLDVATRSFRAPHALRALVARLAQAFDPDLQLLALRFECQVSLAVELETPAREIRDHAVE